MVLLIMGLLAGLAGAIVRPDERGLLRVEAERLARLLELAATESHLTGKSIAWTADATGYRFWRLVGEAGESAQWFEIRDNDLLRARILPQGMVISDLQVENMPAHGATRVEFAAYGPALSFSVQISLGPAHYAVAATPIGELRVSPGNGYSYAGPAS